MKLTQAREWKWYENDNWYKLDLLCSNQGEIKYLIIINKNKRYNALVKEERQTKRNILAKFS